MIAAQTTEVPKDSPKETLLARTTGRSRESFAAKTAGALKDSIPTETLTWLEEQHASSKRRIQELAAQLDAEKKRSSNLETGIRAFKGLV